MLTRDLCNCLCIGWCLALPSRKRLGLIRNVRSAKVTATLISSLFSTVVVCLYVCASVCVPVRVSVSVYLSLCVQVNGVDIAGVGQEELVCMLRSTRQGECVCLGVLRQDEMFLPRELVRPNNCPPSATPDRPVANRMGLFN